MFNKQKYNNYDQDGLGYFRDGQYYLQDGQFYVQDGTAKNEQIK